MRYALMHKDVEVADLDISPESGSVGRILLVRQPEHMPVGTCIKGHVDGTRLKQWWKDRSIPAGRSGIGHLLESLGIDDTLLLLTGSMGLSLSDHYWIKKADCNVTWFDVNFFDNDFLRISAISCSETQWMLGQSTSPLLITPRMAF